MGGLLPIGQMDDPELVRELAEEETLVDLQNIEYDREALSVGRGVAMSAIPGAGWSLMYANRTAQGILVMAAAVAGYTVGAAFLLGAFDEQTIPECRLTAFDFNTGAEGTVAVSTEYCNPASTTHPFKSMPNGEIYVDRNLLNNPTAPAGREFILNQNPPPPGYAQPLYTVTSQKYQENGKFDDNHDDNVKTGQIIIATTYAVTTALAAIWSWIEISDQNDELRKRIESTAQGPNPTPTYPSAFSAVKPTFQYDGQQTIMGVGGQF